MPLPLAWARPWWLSDYKYEDSFFVCTSAAGPPEQFCTLSAYLHIDKLSSRLSSFESAKPTLCHASRSTS